MLNSNLYITDPFLKTFYYVEKRNGILRKNRGEGFEKSTYPYMGVREVKNCQNHPYVIIEWSTLYVIMMIVWHMCFSFRAST